MKALCLSIAAALLAIGGSAQSAAPAVEFLQPPSVCSAPVLIGTPLLYAARSLGAGALPPDTACFLCTRRLGLLGGASCVDFGAALAACDAPHWSAAELNPYSDYYIEVVTSNASWNALHGPVRSCTFAVVSDRPLAGLVCSTAYRLYLTAAGVAAATLLMALCVFPVISCHRPRCCVRAAATTAAVTTALDEHFAALTALVAPPESTSDGDEVLLSADAQDADAHEADADTDAREAYADAHDFGIDVEEGRGERQTSGAETQRARGLRQPPRGRIRARGVQSALGNRALALTNDNNFDDNYDRAALRNPVGCGWLCSFSRLRRCARTGCRRDAGGGARTAGPRAAHHAVDGAAPVSSSLSCCARTTCARSVLKHLYVAPALLLTLSSASVVIVFSVSAVVASALTVTLNVAHHSHDPAAILCTTQSGEAGAALSTALAAFVGVLFKTLTAGMLGAKAATADEDEESTEEGAEGDEAFKAATKSTSATPRRGL